MTLFQCMSWRTPRLADRFAAGTRTFYEYIHSFYACIKCHFRSIAGSHLGGVRRILFGTFETHFTGA